MAKHLIKANTLTAETDKISAERRLQYTEVWNFDPLDLVTRQWVEEAVGGTNGFILNQNEDVQPADFRISGTGEALSFKTGLFFINDDRLSMSHMLWSTGLHSFAGLTITSPTTFNIGAMSGYIVDNTDPVNPTLIEVNYPGSTGNTTPFLGTGPSTFISIDTTGTIVYNTDFPSEAFHRSHIQLGALAHPQGQLIAVTNKTDVLFSPMSQVRDMFRAFRYINDGVMCFPNAGGTLQLANTSGKLYGLGIGFVTNGKNQPSSLDIPAGAPTVFQYRTRTGVGGPNTSLIDPANYDVGGVVTPVPGGGSVATNQRVYLSETGIIRVQYGQTVYPTLAEAISNSSTESFVVFSNNRLFGILIAIISVEKTATNLADTAHARILSVSKFGEAVGGAAGLATGSLQTAYNNSVNPEITTNSINGALTIRRGSASDTDNVFEVQNGAGTITSSIQGDGFIRGNNIFSLNEIRANINVRADNSFLVGTGTGTQGGNDNLIKSFSGSAYLNIKGGAGRSKIVLGDDEIDLISGTIIGIKFNGGANSSTSLGSTFGTMFPNGNWAFATSPVDNGFKLEVVGTSRFAGNTFVGTNTAASALVINGPVGSLRNLFFHTASISRWSINTNAAPETGTNNGSHFTVNRYDDSGVGIDTTILIRRDNGFIGIGPSINPISRLQVDGRITITNPPSSEALRVVNDSGFISFWDTANATRFGFLQSSGTGFTLIQEQGNRFILLNPSGIGNIGLHAGNNPQAKLQVGNAHTPGTGEATYRGYIQINHSNAQSTNNDGGLEFKLDSTSNGYGKRIIGAFDGAADYDLLFQSRTATANWSNNMKISSGSGFSRVTALKNTALNNLLYTNSHFEAQTNDGSPASIGLHRAGFSAIAIYHNGAGANDLLRIRSGGNDYTVWHEGNFSPVAGSGTLDQVLTNGNISDPPSRFAIIGRIAIGKSAIGYGTIGENYVTTGTSNLYNYYDVGSNFSTQIDFDSGNINFKTAPQGTAPNPITFTSRLFVRNSDGNVGIGTTSPSQKLQVIGSGEFGASGVNSNTTKVFIKNDAGKVWALSSGVNNVHENHFGIYNFTDNVFPVVVQNDGNVGIGTVSPLSRLHVTGGRITVSSAGAEGARFVDDAAYISFWNGANSLRSGYLQASASGNVTMQSEQGSQFIFLNPAGGNVGIGTSSPDSILTIDRSGSAQIMLRANGLNRGFLYVDPGEFSIGTPGGTSHNLLFQTNGATRVTILTSGNIGIGTTGPSEKLEVVGNVKATEFIRTSSIANKTNVEDYTDSALDILLDTKIRTYEKIDTGEFGIGFIAEDTNEILSGENRDVHNFGAHLALLTKAIQELKEEIERLKKN